MSCGWWFFFFHPSCTTAAVIKSARSRRCFCGKLAPAMQAIGSGTPLPTTRSPRCFHLSLLDQGMMLSSSKDRQLSNKLQPRSGDEDVHPWLSHFRLPHAVRLCADLLFQCFAILHCSVHRHQDVLQPLWTLNRRLDVTDALLCSARFCGENFNGWLHLLAASKLLDLLATMIVFRFCSVGGFVFVVFLRSWR